MAHEGPQEDGADSGSVRTSRGWMPSRALAAGAIAIVLCAALVGAVGILDSNGEPETEAAIGRSRDDGIVAGAVTEPASEPDEATSSTSSTSTPRATAAAGSPVFPTPVQSSQAVSPTPVALSTAAPPEPTVIPSATPAPVSGGAAITPAAPTPAPTPQLAVTALELLRQIESTHGVRILLAGQHWGITEADQLRNIAAIATALESVPATVLAGVLENEGGPLTFLSNAFGRTEDGWQPYGNRAANFYTNEDQGPNGRRAANQVVLQPGSIAQTIAHELVHAYQLRSIAPGEYVKALLTEEMKSFMAATGWRQLVSDEEVLVNSFRTWDEINAMYAYDGRSLTYLNEHGTVMNLYAPNPLEAYAEAAGLYYARSFAMELPDWPEYWSWFDANLGVH